MPPFDDSREAVLRDLAVGYIDQGQSILDMANALDAAVADDATDAAEVARLRAQLKAATEVVDAKSSDLLAAYAAIERARAEDAAEDAGFAARIKALEAEAATLKADDAADAATIAALRAEITQLKAGVPATPAPATPTPSAPTAPAWEVMAPTPRLSWPARVDVPLGATEAWVPVSASSDVTVTMRATPGARNLNNVLNVTGEPPRASFNVGTEAALWVGNQDMVWRPGDDRTQWLRVSIRGTASLRGTPGAGVEVSLNPFGGGSEAAGFVKVVMTEGAAAQAAPAGVRSRLPKRLNLSAQPALKLDLAAVRWSPTGRLPDGTSCLESKLAHGREQLGNAELGAYLDETVPGAQSPIQKLVDGAGRPVLRLHSCRLPQPVVMTGGGMADRTYNFQAVMVNFRTMDEWCQQEGIWTSWLVTPDRDGAWSAKWLIGKRRSTDSHGWPPEIDGFEHFNDNRAIWLKSGRVTSSAIHAGRFGSNVRNRVLGMPHQDLTRQGFAPDTDLYRQIHRYDVMVELARPGEPYGWVTHFIDGIEVRKHPNLAVPEPGFTSPWDYFLMLNVAVKPASKDDPYDQGSGDMDIYGVEYRPLSGGTLTDETRPKPYPNGQVLPGPF